MHGSSSCALDPSEGSTTPTTSAAVSSTLGRAAALVEEQEEGSGEQEASCCIPVFIVNADTVIGNKAVTAGSVSISGMSVISDPFLGHIALFRTTTGLVSAVNLTVHTKLCELQASLQVSC